MWKPHYSAIQHVFGPFPPHCRTIVQVSLFFDLIQFEVMIRFDSIPPQSLQKAFWTLLCPQIPPLGNLMVFLSFSAHLKATPPVENSQNTAPKIQITLFELPYFKNF